MHVGLSSVVRVNHSGGDLRIVGSLSNVIRFTFFSAPGVKTAADLKGGVVGVSSFGSESDSTVTLALQKLGLSRDDVVIKEFGGGKRRLAAVKSGEIKATALNEPLSSQARAERVNVLVDLVPDQIHGCSAASSYVMPISPRGTTCSRGFSKPVSRAITLRSPMRSAPDRFWQKN